MDFFGRKNRSKISLDRRGPFAELDRIAGGSEEAFALAQQIVFYNSDNTGFDHLAFAQLALKIGSFYDAKKEDLTRVVKFFLQKALPKNMASQDVLTAISQYVFTTAWRDDLKKIIFLKIFEKAAADFFVIENLNVICAQPEFVRRDKDFQNYIVKGFLLQASAVGRALENDGVKNFVPQLSDFVRVFAVSDVASESSVHLESFGKIAPAMRSFAPELKNKIAQEFLQRCHDLSFTQKSSEVLCKQIELDGELDGDKLKKMFGLRSGGVGLESLRGQNGIEGGGEAAASASAVLKIKVAPAPSAIASGVASAVANGERAGERVINFNS